MSIVLEHKTRKKSKYFKNPHHRGARGPGALPPTRGAYCQISKAATNKNRLQGFPCRRPTKGIRSIREKRNGTLYTLADFTIIVVRHSQRLQLKRLEFYDLSTAFDLC